MTLKTISLAALVLMAGALVALWMTGALLSNAPAVIAAQVAAVGLMIWARVTFGSRSFHAAADATGGGLVTTGPYRYIRHPIYTAACLFGWAGILAHPSVASVLLGGLLFAGALGRMLCEERLVTEVYPEYLSYARTTKRMVPYLF